jgi:hypothetical protein
MRKTLIAACALWIFACPALARLQKGDSMLTLSGGGASTVSGDNSFSLSVSAQLSHMVTNEFEILVADAPGYTDAGPGSSWTNTFAIGLAYNVPGIKIADKDFVPFIGGSCGYMSGFGDDTFTTGAFGGARYFVDKSTFIFGQVAYSWGWNGSESDALLYSLGIGWKF